MSSTVQDIYNVLQYRRDIQPAADDLIHVVNAAVRTIAKRLYFLKSSLVISELAVDVFAEQSYTASMAFTASTSTVAGTITDAAVQFVIEDFVADMPITTTHATNPGPFRIATVAAGALTLALTNTVTTATASSITVTSDDAYGFLPDDFWGLVDKPFINGKTYPLIPLPSQDVALNYTGSGDPIYYKIKGTEIYVYPETGADYTIKGDYFQKPTALTGVTSTVPFNELFDDLIAEYVVRYFRGESKGSGQDRLFLDKELKEGVDLIVSKYDRSAPVSFSGINWST